MNQPIFPNTSNLLSSFLRIVAGIFTFLIITASGLRAQETIVSVLNSDNHKPLAGVSIFLIDQENSLITDCSTGAEGKCSFTFQDLARTAKLKIEHHDYNSFILSIEELKKSEYTILLERTYFDMEEVVFIANRHKERRSDIPNQIQIIKPIDITLGNPQTSADMLAQNGQVFVQKSQQGGGSPNLRGFEANKVLLVVDGIRMNNAIYRSGHLQNVITIDPAMIQRTEIMFGPGSVIYGSDALGGVMHFYTRPPALSSKDEVEIQGQHYARYHHANRATSLHSDINFGFEKWAALTSISLNRFGDLRVGQRANPDYPTFGLRPNYIDPTNFQDVLSSNPESHRMVPTGYSQLDFTQKLLFVPSAKLKHQFQFQYSSSTNINRFDRLTQLRDGNLRYAEWYYGPQERLMFSYHLSAYEPKPLYDQLDLITAWQDLDESRINREVGASLRNHRLEDVKVGSFNLNLTKTLANVHELAYGLDFAYNRVNSTAFSESVSSGERLALDTRYPDGGTDWLSAAAYFTHRWEISPKIMLTDGIRFNHVSLNSQFVDTSFYQFPFDHIQQNNSSLSGNLGVVFKLPANFRFSTTTGTGFRAPNLDDVAKVFDSQPGNVVVPNPDLKPETTYNLEFSLGKYDKIRMFELVAWYTWYQDAIVLRSATYNGQSEILYEGVLSQVQMNQNAGQARILGASLNTWYKWRSLKLAHSITYTYGQDLSSDVPLDHIPPLFGRASLQYANGPWKAELSVPYQGWKRLNRFSPRDEGDIDFATPDGWPSWVIFTLRGTYKLDNGMRLQLGCENILDQHYRPFSSRISAPGRNLFVAIRSSF